MIRVIVGLLAIVLCSLEVADPSAQTVAPVLEDAPAVKPSSNMSIDEEAEYVADAIRGGAQALVCAGGPGSTYCNWCLSGGCHGQSICWGACLACCT